MCQCCWRGADMCCLIPAVPHCEPAHCLVMMYWLKCSLQTVVNCATGSVVDTCSACSWAWGVCWCMAVCDAMCDIIFQEERYEEEDGVDERILGSNFSPGRNVEVFELPDSEALFMPTNMDSSQMAFKFKEVSPTSWLNCLTWLKWKSKFQYSV